MNAGLDVVLVYMARVVADNHEVAAHRQAEASGQRLAQFGNVFKPDIKIKFEQLFKHYPKKAPRNLK